MKNIITIALCIVALRSQAQTQQADTLTLAVFNTARNFIVTAADFGGKLTQDLIGEMVRTYDTVRILKEHSSKGVLFFMTRQKETQ